jgi:hypothetical protein
MSGCENNFKVYFVQFFKKLKTIFFWAFESEKLIGLNLIA